MKLRRLLVRYATALRLLLVACSLALALNGMAYVAHYHTVDTGNGPVAHVELCGYCSAFGGMAASVSHHLQLQPALAAFLLLLSVATFRWPRRVLTAAQARAPPTR
jgi:hypothetical protein